MDLRIQKRDGSIQQYNQRNIHRALLLAFCEYGDVSLPAITQLTLKVEQELSKLQTENCGIVTIERVQQIVESVLQKQHPAVAELYTRYRKRRDEARRIRLQPDPSAIADYIHMSKYSRFDFDRNRREVFNETVARVCEMHVKKYPQIKGIIKDAFEKVHQKRVLPSMRSMQFAGIAVDQHNARMYNCSFTLIDSPDVFGKILYLLLCGCGVGFSVQWDHISKLPPIGHLGKTVHHVNIGDSIEGWGDAVNALVADAIAGVHTEFNYSFIRPAGSPLVTSGGLAPGHLPLKKSLECVRKVLNSAQGRRLRPVECHDIICYLAEAVLAGGIRRSSLISLFSAHDTEMLYCKAAGNFNPVTGLNAQRMMANNSAVILRDAPDADAMFSQVIGIAEEGWGEPGFYFSNNIDYGCNPCGEIGLHPVTDDGRTGFSFCNLCEVNVAAAQSAQEFLDAVEAATIIGTLQAGYTDFSYLGAATEEIAKRDALLGVGLCGMMDNPELAFDPALLRKAAQLVLDTNETIAKLIGINPAARTTTIKPGGTAPLELGCVACGIHPHHARRYFRRVTANPLEPALQHFIKHNPHMVVSKPNGDQCIVFPVEAPGTAKTVKEMSAVEFMENIFLVYTNWVQRGTRDPKSDLTHNVSATVTMKPEERADVMKAVLNNKDRIAAMAFAPHLLDKKYPFAPREEVTAADEPYWNYLISLYRKVDWKTMREPGMENLDAGMECSGVRCEI